MKEFKIVSVNISRNKGTRKTPVKQATLVEDFGIEGDAHGGKWHRQVSLLAYEDIEEMIQRGFDLSSGDFAGNITTKGVELSNLPVGTRLYIGDTIMEITQIGKECHNKCAIYYQAGDCIMPRKGIFARVIKGGEINNESSCYYDIRPGL